MAESQIQNLESINEMNLRQAAAAYEKMGFSLVPLLPGEKRAYHEGWSSSEYKCTAVYWDYFPGDNIGLKSHASGLMIVDIDDKDAFRTAMNAIKDKACTGVEKPYWDLDTTGIISGVPGKGKLVFKLPNGVSELPYYKLNWADSNGKVKTVFELRCADNLQDVAPPSIHPKTRRPYRWHGDTPLDAPSDLLNLWANWNNYLNDMQRANPDHVEPKPEAKRAHQRIIPAINYISMWVDTQNLSQWLERCGYKKVGNRYLSPHSTTGNAGVVLHDSGRTFFSHGQSDPFADGHGHDAYDLLVRCECGGDSSEAYQRILKDLGVFDEEFGKKKHQQNLPEKQPEPAPAQEPPADAARAELPVMNYFICEKGKRTKINYLNLKREAVNIMHPVTFNDVLWVYQKSTGIYIQDPSGKHVKGWVDGIFDLAARDKYVNLPESDTQVERAKAILYSYMSSYNVISGDDSPFNMYDGVPAANCVILFNGDGAVTTKPFSPEMMFTWKMDTAYNPSANPDGINRILDSWIDQEKRIALIDPLAQAIVQSLPSMQNIRTAHVFIGDRRGGKSTYTNLLKRVVGEKNTSGVPLQDMDKPFRAASLEGKMLNINDEMPHVGIEGGQTFMSMVSNKRQMIERKYQVPYNTHIHAVHIFATNKPPSLSPELQSESAWWDRFRLHTFERVHENQPNWERDNFTKENLEAFLMLAVKAASDIIQNHGRLIYRQEPEEVMAAWLNDSDPMARFLKENFVTGNPADWVKKIEVLKAVLEFRETVTDSIDKINVPTEMNSLTTKLRSRGIFAARISSPDNYNEKIYVYRGLKWSPESKLNKDTHTQV